MDLVQIYFKMLIKLQLYQFPCIFSVIFQILPPASGERRKNECGSGSTALKIIITNTGTIIYLLVNLSACSNNDKPAFVVADGGE